MLTNISFITNFLEINNRLSSTNTTEEQFQQLQTRLKQVETKFVEAVRQLESKNKANNELTKALKMIEDILTDMHSKMGIKSNENNNNNNSSGDLSGSQLGMSDIGGSGLGTSPNSTTAPAGRRTISVEEKLNSIKQKLSKIIEAFTVIIFYSEWI